MAHASYSLCLGPSPLHGGPVVPTASLSGSCPCFLPPPQPPWQAVSSRSVGCVRLVHLCIYRAWHSAG